MHTTGIDRLENLDRLSQFTVGICIGTCMCLRVSQKYNHRGPMLTSYTLVADMYTCVCMGEANIHVHVILISSLPPFPTLQYTRPCNVAV